MVLKVLFYPKPDNGTLLFSEEYHIIKMDIISYFSSANSTILQFWKKKPNSNTKNNIYIYIYIDIYRY